MDVSGVTLDFLWDTHGTLRALPFLSVFFTAMDIVLFKSHNGKEWCKKFCFFLYSHITNKIISRVFWGGVGLGGWAVWNKNLKGPISLFCFLGFVPL